MRNKYEKNKRFFSCRGHTDILRDARGNSLDVLRIIGLILPYLGGQLILPLRSPFCW
tara:strand:+ start:210 stop:380 length:171 start_codon:yes stop_codon:yes gene_type:complete